MATQRNTDFQSELKFAVSEQTWRKYFRGVPVKATDMELRTYSSEPLKVLGKCSVKIGYGTQVVDADIYIVDGKGPSLLGRDLLHRIQLDWASIAAVRTKVETNLKKLLDQYQVIFDEKIGTFCHYRHLLPKFCRSRPIPFALKEAVEEELHRLEAQGIVEHVSSSEWATPIVVVPKKDGRLRLCWDYKVTINPALEVESYPIPKPQELFAASMLSF